jgi:Flp pilus assembly pilin Flp
MPPTFWPALSGSLGIIRITMRASIRQILVDSCRSTEGQDVAEYAIMLAVVLVIVMGMVKMVGANVSTVASTIGACSSFSAAP